MAVKLKPRREQIVDFFLEAWPPDIEYSCTDICKRIMHNEMQAGIRPKSNHGYHYLSGSVSGQLRKMVKDGTLRYSVNKTPRGGYLYMNAADYL